MKGSTDLVSSAAYRPEPAAVAAARKFVRDTLQSWLPGGPGAGEDAGLVDDAVLLTSELVTNAIVHAGTDVQVTCKLAGRSVEVLVRDSHPARMVPGPAKDDQVPAERTGGRGLLLPSALASAWGVSYGSDTKAVWFRMVLGRRPTGRDEPGTGPDLPPGPPPALPVAPWPVRVGPSPRLGPGDGPPEADAAAAGPDAGPSYDDLLRQCVATARVIVAADAGYALAADEDGNLTVRASAGISPAALLRTAPSVTTVPFLADGRVTGVLAVAALLPGRFGDSDVQRLQRLADNMAPVLERARLAGLERARRARIAVLTQAAGLLAGPLEPGAILTATTQVVVPRLADWCALLTAEPGPGLRVATARHADETAREALAWVLDRGCAVLPWPRPASGPAPGPASGRAGDPWRWELGPLAPPGAPPGAADLAARGAWCFPLAGRSAPSGLLVLGGPHAGRPSREVVSLVQDLAGRVGLALENARLATGQQAGQRALQAALIPAALPQVPGLDLAVAHDLPGAGEAAGGDFCDVFPVAGGRWRFAVGEVCGAGPATLAVTSLARAALRMLGGQGLSVPDVLGRLNQLILGEGTPGAFLTLVHGEIVPGTPAQVFLACAGQPLPLLLRGPGDSLPAAGAGSRPGAGPGPEAAAGAAGPAAGAAAGAEPGQPDGPQAAAVPQPVLGVIDGLGFAAQPVVLSPGDLLLCVTDGVTRRRDGDRLLDDDNGLARLLSGCAGLTAGVVADKVHEEVRGFGGRPAADGMAVLAIRALSA